LLTLATHIVSARAAMIAALTPPMADDFRRLAIGGKT
jgi:hypothetical protein